MLYKKDQISGIRERLQHGKLTDADRKILDDLLHGVEEIAGMETTKEGNRRVVARLPFGMDVVK